MDIPVNNAYVSRHHAELIKAENQYQIRDLGSKNGTYINGTRLERDPAQLHSGDRIELAKGQVVLRFQEWRSTITLPPSVGPAAAAGIRVDASSREVWVYGQLLVPPLSRKEFDVLELLYRRRGQACSKDGIAAHGWPERHQGDVGDQEIEQCIRRIRLRVERDPSRPQYLVTVRGYGYKLSPE